MAWINHLPPACWSAFWKSNFKQQLGCRFDIMDYISYFFRFWHMQLYMSWYIRSFFGCTFLNILYFSSTLVLTSSIDVVVRLSIGNLKFDNTWSERLLVFNSTSILWFEWNFRHVLFELILVVGVWVISCEITIRWISTLLQIMTWPRQVTNTYMGQNWPRFMFSYGMTRPLLQSGGPCFFS